jgi:nitroreductase
MEKIAEVKYPINELISRRWSPRIFDPDKLVDLDQVGSLFEAARWAPSCANEQSWRFIVGVNFDKTHQMVIDTLSDGNKKWASNCPILFIAIANQPDYEGKSFVHAEHDLGLALQNLLLQAIDLGMHAHLMAGFSADKVRRAFDVPDENKPLTAGAVGYYGDVRKADAGLRQKDEGLRSRKTFDQFVFSGRWGIPLGI